MVVYRLCDSKEVQNIICNRSFDEVGSTFERDSKKNNHKYSPNIKYLHFFKDFDSLFYLGVRSGTYICTYDIPDSVLRKFMADGFYLDRVFLRDLENVPEYAVPTAFIIFDYLKKVDKVTNDIDFEEFAYDDYKNSIYNMYDFTDQGKKLRNTLGQS